MSEVMFLMRPDPRMPKGQPTVVEDPFWTAKKRQVKGPKGGYGPQASSDEQISVTGGIEN